MGVKELRPGMNLESVEWLRCIACGAPLRAESASPAENNGIVTEGKLICTSCGRVFPIVRSIARFVPSEGYAHSFGYQWNYFDKTQLDSHMGNDLSRERFFATTQWPQKMDGQVILEAGCGMGRFTQIALETGAELFSFDLSNAVEANLRNNGDSSRVHIVQASIYEIPFRKESFDKVFCMGVLQHCPDVRAAFMSLVPFLRPGGEIVIDVYQKHTGLFPPLKYWARPFLTWMGPQGVHRFLSLVIPPAFLFEKGALQGAARGKTDRQSHSYRPGIACAKINFHGRRAGSGENPERPRYVLSRARPSANARHRAPVVFRRGPRGCLHRDRIQWDQRKRKKAMNAPEEFEAGKSLRFSGLSSGTMARGSSEAANAEGVAAGQRRRILILASHVIQYSSPLFRRMAQDPRLDLQIAYCTCKARNPRSTRNSAWKLPGTHPCWRAIRGSTCRIARPSRIGTLLRIVQSRSVGADSRESL